MMPIGMRLDSRLATHWVPPFGLDMSASHAAVEFDLPNGSRLSPDTAAVLVPVEEVSPDVADRLTVCMTDFLSSSLLH